jgi:putative ABC transport system permease protein
MATRAALGAARGRLVRQMLTESVLLSLLGGVFGILLGIWASRLLASIQLRTSIPVYFDFRFDWRVFGFGLVAALLTGVIVGIVPAFRVSRNNLAELMHEGGRGGSARRSRLRSGLVIAQVTGSMVLLIVAGLFARSLGQASHAELGFDDSHLINVLFDPNEIGYKEDQARIFDRRLLDRVRALPGVRSATIAFAVPMGYIGNGDTLKIPGYQPAAGEPDPAVAFNMVTGDYFKTMGIPLVAGREFTEADSKEAQFVAVVNQTMATQYWPKQDPIGREFQLVSDPKHTVRVVGVAKDSRSRNIKGQVRPYFYVPLAQNFSSFVALQVRTEGEPAPMIPVLEKQIAEMAPDLPLFEVETMTDALYTLNGLLIFELGAGMTGALGFLGLVLAVVGVYGVVSFAASQRTREIGIRMALGAEPAGILMLVLRQGIVIIGVGVIAGLAVAFASARLVKNYLVGVSATDPLTYVGVTLLLILIALTACYVPARRAMRVDPVVALRYE